MKPKSLWPLKDFTVPLGVLNAPLASEYAEDAAAA
jgi:hypothetical protein